MIHAVYFTKDNDLDWLSVIYNSRYVQTETFLQENRENKPVFLPSIEGDSPAVIVGYLLNLVGLMLIK